MNNYEIAYKALLYSILHSGIRKEGRNGWTKSKFGLTLSVDLKEGFPVLTGRKMHYKGVVGEMAGFIRGCEILGDYKDLGCNYWDANAEAWSVNFGKNNPNDMSIGQYVGSLWRDFSAYSEIQSDDHTPRDQLRVLIDQLKYDPSSRRHVLSAWHPAAKSCLPPCTVMAIFNVEGKHLNCHVTQRSADMCLGVPSDVLGYALLLALLAQETGRLPGKLMFTFVDAHIYKEHIVPLEGYLQAPIIDLPQALISNDSFFEFTPADFELVGYNPAPAVAFPFVA